MRIGAFLMASIETFRSYFLSSGSFVRGFLPYVQKSVLKVLKGERYDHRIVFSTAPNNCRDVSAMFRKHKFLKTERYLFISILFTGICHHPDFLFIFLYAGGCYG